MLCCAVVFVGNRVGVGVGVGVVLFGFRGICVVRVALTCAVLRCVVLFCAAL